MSGETIELLKGYEPKKMQWPAYMSEKLDGVPVRIIRSDATGVEPFTRQGEIIRSIDHIVSAAARLLSSDGASFVGELYIDGMPFKEISGLVRQHDPAPELRLYVFDADLHPDHDEPYSLRMKDFERRLRANPTDLIKIIPTCNVLNAEGAEGVFANFMQAKPQAEGYVLHSASKTFQPGKRCWGTQRMKPSPTLDLKVHSYEEAISKTGEPMGMVGRINVHYERRYAAMADGVPNEKSIIGIGPGALDHTERRRIWERQDDGLGVGEIIEVKYMKDDTYAALRQPTFVRFRPDKTEGEVHHV